MARPVRSLVIFAFVLLIPGAASAARGYVPPVTFEDKADVTIWFGRVNATGKWCEFDRQTLERRSEAAELIPGSFGWARYDGPRLQSITYAQQSEDAYVEDRYYIGPKNEVQKMVRTGHYINDPWVSVTFEPDPTGRLGLSAQSRAVVEKMTADGQQTYFVDWDHFSRVSQVPFSNLLKVQGGRMRTAC